MNQKVQEAMDLIKDLRTEEVEYILLELMKIELISFISLNKKYIEFLEYKRQSLFEEKVEISNCLYMLMPNKYKLKSKDKIYWKTRAIKALLKGQIYHTAPIEKEWIEFIKEIDEGQ